MEAEDLERAELVELVDMLSDRLGKSIKSECVMIMRVKALVAALEGYGSGEAKRLQERITNLENTNSGLYKAGEAHRIRAENLALERQGWEESYDCSQQELEEAKRELERAKVQWKNFNDEYYHLKTSNESMAKVNDNLRLTLEEQRTYLVARDANVRRLERELREVRATVMDEVSAMIPRAVEAERDACADIARVEAIECAIPENSSLLMAICNMIKLRGSK